MSESRKTTCKTEKPTLKDDEVEIEGLTLNLVRILNSRDFSYQSPSDKAFLVHVATDFEARFDTADYTFDWSAQTGKWREDARDYPDLQFDVLELTTNVKRRSATATVYLKLVLTRTREDIQYLGACQLDWRWSDDTKRWLLTRHVTMRGILPPDGSAI